MSSGTSEGFVDMILYLLNGHLNLKGKMARIKIRLIIIDILINC